MRNIWFLGFKVHTKPNNLCLHSRFGMIFLFLDQVFGETLNTHPAPPPQIELCLAHVSLVFLHMFCSPAWFSSVWGGGGVFSVLCWEGNSIYMIWIWQIALRIFATWTEKKGRRYGRCKGDFFGKIGPKSPLIWRKNKVTKILEES